MGLYISDNQFSVLIDGLHTKYGDDYLFPTEELVNKISTKLKPDVILFTHYHGDHFSAQLAKNYLQTNQKAKIFGPNQVTNNVTTFNDRVHSISVKNYTKQTTIVGNNKIIGLKIDHAGKRHAKVENVGYIVNIGSKKILHVGDTNWLEEIQLFDKLELFKEEIDIAILPYWMLMQNNAADLIKKHIGSKLIIATHISPRIKEQELLKLKDQYPNIHFLTKLEQQIQL